MRRCRLNLNRTLLGLALLCFADPALAGRARAGNIAPVMIAPVLSAGTLALLVGALVSGDRQGEAGRLAGGAVLVLTIVLSRLLAGYGYLAAIIPQVIIGVALLVAWRKAA